MLEHRAAHRKGSPKTSAAGRSASGRLYLTNLFSRVNLWGNWNIKNKKERKIYDTNYSVVNSSVFSGETYHSHH